MHIRTHTFARQRENKEGEKMFAGTEGGAVQDFDLHSP